MISKEHIKIVKNSASTITHYGPEITTRMYEIMFKKFPNAKKLFKDAPEDQYMKLSDALSAYAINIDKLHLFQPALMRIAKMHVRTGITSSMYPMVRYALLQAMKEVLIDKGRGDEICLEAWSAAYDHLADILIEMENKLYDEL